jgi:hypothetical protein
MIRIKNCIPQGSYQGKFSFIKDVLTIKAIQETKIKYKKVYACKSCLALLFSLMAGINNKKGIINILNEKAIILYL